ncbi:MAG TPA: YjgN family protein [Dokdonella sp.]|uniref:YjgN family protein n=1 Tax=Dokdonella sp. TaxID=2291710 RepID=UPI002D7F4A9B|nr:YjgN family protein [Dokdonella sp.]HET9031626.1 YjgN family protein [Dokdonella sp.]
MEEQLVAVPAVLPPPEPPVPDGSRPASAPPVFEHRFIFDGRAGEYFRIWIVNLALTILSLGIFSAWAKVRTQRYFYASTRLAGMPFEYTAKPLPILKGRIIAVTLFSAYILAGQYSIGLQLGLALFIAVLTPWLIVRGAAFRARYSSWRGLNFRFIPDYGEAYIRFLILGIPLILTLGLLYPWVKGKQKAFIVENHRFGGNWFKFLLNPGQFYPPYLIAWGAITAWMFVFSMLMFGVIMASASVRSGEAPADWLVIGMTAFMYLGYFIVLAFLAAAIANLIYRHIEIDGRRFHSTLKGQKLLWIYASNTIAILLSVGLLIPWAMVRLAQYRADCLSLLASDDFNNMVAERSFGVDATAAEVDGLFDIDIGW